MAPRMASGSVRVSTLPPKPPPTVPPMKCSWLEGTVEDLRRRIEGEEQRLRAGIDGIAAVGVGRGDRAVGLGRRVLDRRHLVALLEHVVGTGERLLHVAVADLLMVVLAVILEGVLRIDLVHHRRAGLERLLDVEHRRQRIVVDPDLADGLVGFALAVGDHRDDRLAPVADLVDRQRRLVVLAELEQAEQRIEVHRDVGAADDAAHARRALGGRRRRSSGCARDGAGCAGP